MDLEWNWRDRRNSRGGAKSQLGKKSVSPDNSLSSYQHQKSDLVEFSEVASSFYEESKKDLIKTRMDKLLAELKPQCEPVFGKSLEEEDLERQRKVKEKFGSMLDDSMVFSMKKTKVQLFSLMSMEQFGDGKPGREEVMETESVETEASRSANKIGDATPMTGLCPDGNREHLEGFQTDSVQERKLHSPSPIPMDSKPYIMEIIKDHERLMKMASSIIKTSANDFPIEIQKTDNMHRVSHSKETIELELKTPSHFLAEVEEVEEVKVSQVTQELGCEVPSAGQEPQVEQPVTGDKTQTSFHGTGLGVDKPEAGIGPESDPKGLRVELKYASSDSIKPEGENENLKPEDLEDCLDEDMYDKIMAWLESNEVVQEEDVYSSETPKGDKEAAEPERHPSTILEEDENQTSFCGCGTGDVHLNGEPEKQESFCSYCEELHKIAEMSNKSQPLSRDVSERKTSARTPDKSQADPSFILTREEPHTARHLAPYKEHHGPDCKARPTFFRHLRKLYKKILGSDDKESKGFSLMSRLYLCYPLSFCFTPEQQGGSSYLSVKSTDISYEVEDKEDSFLQNCSPSLIMDGATDSGDEEEEKRTGPSETNSVKIEACARDSVFSYSRKTVPGITTV